MLLLYGTAFASSLSQYAQDHLSFRGYGELRFTYSDQTGTPWQSVERIRPTIKWMALDRLSLTITPQLSLTQGRYETKEFITLLEDPIEDLLSGQTIDDVIESCDWEIERERTINEMGDVLTFPRVYVDITAPLIDLRIGRQTANWGSALFFNPTDVLAENLLASPWQERQGVNAVRGSVPIGEDGLLLSLLTVDDSFSSWKAAVKGGRNIQNTDVFAVGYLDSDTALVGMDIKGDAIVGFWTEGAYSIPRDRQGTGGVLQISTGIDYSFPIAEQLIVATQVSYDSSGERQPKYYDWAARQPLALRVPQCETYGSLLPASTTTVRQTLGRWYGLLLLRAVLSDMWTIQTTTLFNLSDGTGIVFPAVQWVPGARWELNLGSQLLVGSNGEFRPENVLVSGLDTSALLPTKTALAWVRWSL